MNTVHIAQKKRIKKTKMWKEMIHHSKYTFLMGKASGKTRGGNRVGQTTSNGEQNPARSSAKTETRTTTKLV
tara:strand:+ start:253 stop:468 length:216 start_codon:yes stop_codon:yes gene_type:complete